MKDPSLRFIVTVEVTSEVDEYGRVTWVQDGLTDVVRTAIEESTTTAQRLTMREKHLRVVEAGPAVAANIASQWTSNMKQHMKNIEAERIELARHQPWSKNRMRGQE